MTFGRTRFWRYLSVLIPEFEVMTASVQDEVKPQPIRRNELLGDSNIISVHIVVLSQLGFRKPHMFFLSGGATLIRLALAPSRFLNILSAASST